MKSRVSSRPPRPIGHHIALPDQAARILRATGAHSRGFRGEGIRVAVIDSGFYPHPFYVSRGYRIRYLPTAEEPRPHIDHYGHGTAHLASLFALAPKAAVIAVKCTRRDPSAALEAALAERPHVLTCSWGFDIDCPESAARFREEGFPEEYARIERLIRQATDSGTLVVAAAGNGQRAFPGSMPEALSVGGVTYSSTGEFERSPISSSYESSLYPGRRVPDVCGVMGQEADSVVVPVPPRATLALRHAFSASLRGTTLGWASLSGTSAATAMAAGAAALLRGAVPALDARRAREVLIAGAHRVEGDLLIDVERSLELAMRGEG